MNPYRIVMMGTGTFAEPTLERLLNGSDTIVGVFTQPDRETGTKRGSTRQVGRGIKEIAAERNIAVFQPENANAPEGLAMLSDLKPDLLVVAAYGQILSNELLNIPTVGAINVHASLLPKYRGAAPVAWAIYHGEIETGVTIIRISTGLDAGNMLAQARVTIGPMETAGELESRLAPIGAELALGVIEHMKQGPLPGEAQDKALVTKAPKLKKENGLIDWSQPAARVVRQVQAMQPWPTAYTFLNRVGKEPLRVMILKCTEITYSNSIKPGLIVPGIDRKLIVECGSGAIEIVSLQPAGRKPMAGVEFLRGQPTQPDDSFGNS